MKETWMAGRLKDRVEAETHRVLRERIARAQRAVDEALAALGEPIVLPLAPGEWGAAEGPAHLQVLRDSLEAMVRGGTQREVLTALLDAASAMYPRVALFVVKGGAFAGWAGLGFLGEGGVSSEDVPGLVIPASGRHLLARSARLGALVTVGSEGPGDELLRAMGGVRPRESSAVPILVRGRPAAILYGDTGSGDAGGQGLALEIIARCAGLAMDRLAAGLRRDHPGASEEAPPDAAGASTRSSREPAARSAAPTPPEDAEIQVILGDHSDRARRDRTHDALPEEDRRRLADARRFAQLLVSEMVLYNEEAVAQGRRHRDLYSRLKKEIDRSRQAFESRLAPDLTAASGYFDEELVRVLAQGDRSLLGKP